MREGKRTFLSVSPHPYPLPEGEGILSSVLPMVEICAEQYWEKDDTDYVACYRRVHTQ